MKSDFPRELPASKFNLAYFFKTICEFRQAFGDKTFWAKSEEQRERAAFAVGFVFLNLAGDDGKVISPEDNERATMVYDSTMREYATREAYAILKGWTG